MWKVTVRKFVCEKHDDCDMVRCRYVKRAHDRTYDDIDEVRRVLKAGDDA